MAPENRRIQCITLEAASYPSPSCSVSQTLKVNKQLVSLTRLSFASFVKSLIKRPKRRSETEKNTKKFLVGFSNLPCTSRIFRGKVALRADSTVDYGSHYAPSTQHTSRDKTAAAAAAATDQQAPKSKTKPTGAGQRARLYNGTISD